MDVREFRAKWAGVGPHVSERAAAQEHFGDLCRVFGAPTPNDAHSGDYAFERAVGKLTGGRGFADAWRRGRWAWEDRRSGEDLDKATGIGDGGLPNFLPIHTLAMGLPRFELPTDGGK